MSIRLRSRIGVVVCRLGLFLCFCVLVVVLRIGCLWFCGIALLRRNVVGRRV